jgi:hypothetical protein
MFKGQICFCCGYNFMNSNTRFCLRYNRNTIFWFHGNRRCHHWLNTRYRSIEGSWLIPESSIYFHLYCILIYI